MMAEVYLHGQIRGTHSFLIKGGFPQPDLSSEIRAHCFLSAGETAASVTVLASFGVRVRMDAPISF